MEIQKVIEGIYKRTTVYSDPKQATTTASALDLLSSGIYTEEERFIFELLQNAVDSYDKKLAQELSVKIVSTDSFLVFMHNGTPFSGRDLEGLCDIGNGNKTKDAKKIGYKGIGFKSVFMHSHNVTIWTDGTCFKFDREACEKLCRDKGYPEDTRMPWQIIPILTKKPDIVDTTGYSVVTYIMTGNSQSLRNKIEKLLSDSRFLLFLNVAKLNISFCHNDEEILSLSKFERKGILSLRKNGKVQSRWLTYSKTVELTPEIREEIAHDSKTPTKLKESTSVDISFAIAIDENGDIMPLDDALVYTYLPTSFRFGLPFIVNANFITDAGRQQLVKDSQWNIFIFSQIPTLFFNWIKDDVSCEYSTWYKALPKHIDNTNDLTNSYCKSAEEAVKNIPFVRCPNGDYITVKGAIYDKIGLHEKLPAACFEKYVSSAISDDLASDNIVSEQVGKALLDYNINVVDIRNLSILLEQADQYLCELDDNELYEFLVWLKGKSESLQSDFKNVLSNSKLLFDENDHLTEPVNLFFPSKFRESTEFANDAIVMSESLYSLLSTGVKTWLEELGVQEISCISIIKDVLCKGNYINEQNAIQALQFIYDSSQSENIFSSIDSYKFKSIKILTERGSLKSASELYLSKKYGTLLPLWVSDEVDCLVSSKYIRSADSPEQWAYFLKRLGVSDEIKVVKVVYNRETDLFKQMKPYVEFARRHEYNHSDWTGKNYYMTPTEIRTKFIPLISLQSISYRLSKLVWSSCLNKAFKIGLKDDYIYGSTGGGYYIPAYLSDNTSEHRYIGERFLTWAIQNYSILPGTDGNLHKIGDLLLPTSSNKEIYGPYYPVLDIDSEIDTSWNEYLPFKGKLTLQELLDVLARISEVNDKDLLLENKKRINHIYDIISTEFNFIGETYDSKVISEWGKTHKILSKDGKFQSPEGLYLLSTALSSVDINNQAFHGKFLENERFASMMTAMGVRFINDYNVDYHESDAEKDESFISSLKGKAEFLTAITTSENFSKSSWKKASEKMQSDISELAFYKVPSIKISYGDQSFKKTAYADGSEFYYVGRFGAANQELVHDELSKALNIKDWGTMFAIISMDNGTEIKEYLEQKGYDVSHISEDQVAVLTEDDKDKQIQELERRLALLTGSSKMVLEMGGENALLGGLSKSDMHAALEEAKDTILDRLQVEGYDISCAKWDGWTCIDGVKKDGIEYPLVVRSNRSKSNTIINPKDWNQLMKPNAIFAVNTSSGPGTIRFRDLLKSMDNITIRFSSENIDSQKHIAELAHVLAYFKGIQFDFERYVQPVIGRWERFLAPEQNTGELPQAGSDNLLPD